MIVNVVMLAFQPETQIYPMDVPMTAEQQKALILYMSGSGSDKIIHELLEKLFDIGNRPHRPHGDLFCSVSSGDVALIANEMWLCASVGWHKISVDQMQQYCATPRRERGQLAFILSD